MNCFFVVGRSLPLVAISLAIAGCGGDRGLPRYRLSGEITLDGKLVPVGWIVFTPASGPGASANIRNGRYETPEGFGSVGGKHTIEVVAFEGGGPSDPNDQTGYGPGNLWFTHVFEEDLPAKAATWDIRISSEDIKK